MLLTEASTLVVSWNWLWLSQNNIHQNKGWFTLGMTGLYRALKCCAGRPITRMTRGCTCGVWVSFNRKYCQCSWGRSVTNKTFIRVGWIRNRKKLMCSTFSILVPFFLSLGFSVRHTHTTRRQADYVHSLIQWVAIHTMVVRKLQIQREETTCIIRQYLLMLAAA